MAELGMCQSSAVMSLVDVSVRGSDEQMMEIQYKIQFSSVWMLLTNMIWVLFLNYFTANALRLSTLWGQDEFDLLLLSRVEMMGHYAPPISRCWIVFWTAGTCFYSSLGSFILHQSSWNKSNLLSQLCIDKT